MIRYNSWGMPLKIFVKENEEVKGSVKFRSGFESLSGEKARKFYEDLVNKHSLDGERQKNSRDEPKPREESVKNVRASRIRRASFKNTDLLVMAQNNDVKSLELFFSQKKNFDIDVVDDFGWTPLMCASCSGAEGAVKILLEKGADPSKTDNLGYTCLKLAKIKNHKPIITLLQNLKGDESGCDEKNSVLPSPEPFFCDICQDNFTVNKLDHESSTLHLFNSKHKTTTYYGIPESNKGFQILLKKGWNKEMGLGLNGSGRKFPLKPIIKKNRSGIGAPINEKNNRQSVCSVKNESKKTKIYNRKKQREFEKNFRLEFA